MDKAIVFMVGAAIGSFLNVCIYRLPKGKSIVFPASSCPNCNKAILWHDNIPILSYLLLEGKCRFCKSKISFRYFLVEVMTALLLALLFGAFGLNAKFFAYSVLTCGLIIATFVDFEIQEIPEEVTRGGTTIGLITAMAFPIVFNAQSRWQALSNSFMGAIVGATAIYLLGFFGKVVFKDKIKQLGLKEAMGWGDVELMAMIGAFLGWRLVLLAFFIAPFFGAPVGMILKIKYGREIIPYGPYLSLAAIVAVFYGEKILNIFFHIAY